MSLIGGTTKGDSNFFDGEETGVTGEERAAAPSAAFAATGRLATTTDQHTS